MEFDEKDYEGLGEFLQLFFHILRNSVGDLQLPVYRNWTLQSQEDSFKASMMIHMMWFLWFCNLILMLIILLNFLIAVISQTYERVSGSKVSYTYKDKAEMNVECATILKFIYQQGEVKMIIFSYDKSIWTSDDKGTWGGICDSIKRIIGQSNG